MQLIDFEYNGARLSDYDFMVCSFDGANETVEINGGITVNKVKAPNAHRHMSVGVNYDETFSPTIQICKFSCNHDNHVITEEELRWMTRWLNRKSYCKFKPIYDDAAFTDVYYNATFNIQLVKIGGDVVGMELTMDTDSTYGYVEPVEYKRTFYSTDEKLTIIDFSDEVGYLYCNATIKCLASGELKISNDLDPNNVVIIKNCVANEVITLLGQQKIIQSDKEHKTLYNDFNYNYIRISNTYEDNENVFTTSLPCEVTLTYSPIRKVGLIL